MVPSDMLLRIGQVAGYKNEIVIAGDNKLGVNETVDVSTPPMSTNTGEKGLVKPLARVSPAPATVDALVAPTANVPKNMLANT